MHRCRLLRAGWMPVLVALVASTGCVGSAGQYVVARSNDISDCLRFQLGVGAGIYAEVEASSVLHPSVGFVDASLQPEYTIGWDPRPGRPPGMFRTAAFPTLVLGWPFYGYQESADGYGDTHPYVRGFLAPYILMGTRHVERRSNSLLLLHHLVPNPRLEGGPDAQPAPRRTSDHYWVGGSGTLLLVSFDLAVNLLELLDFLVGLAAFDLLDDDDRPLSDRRAPVPEEDPERDPLRPTSAEDEDERIGQ